MTLATTLSFAIRLMAAPTITPLELRAARPKARGIPATSARPSGATQLRQTAMLEPDRPPRTPQQQPPRTRDRDDQRDRGAAATTQREDHGCAERPPSIVGVKEGVHRALACNAVEAVWDVAVVVVVVTAACIIVVVAFLGPLAGARLGHVVDRQRRSGRLHVRHCSRSAETNFLKMAKMRSKTTSVRPIRSPF